MFKRIVLFLNSFKSQLYVLKGWVVDNAGKKIIYRRINLGKV